ncbi:MAG: hypothetical protein QG567_2466 [Campylobacterota bacterium]|nr:hypothetical protein [Campylobacterota bacterium]
MCEGSFLVHDFCEIKSCKKSDSKPFKIAFGVYSCKAKYNAVGMRWKENPEIEGDIKGYPPTEEGEKEQYFTLPLCLESINKIIAFLEEYKEKLNAKDDNA